MTLGEKDAGIINNTASESLLPKEATKLLQRLASSWSDVRDKKAIEVVQLKGAMTNEVYQINWETDNIVRQRKVLLRIYGEGVDLFFDRTDEIRTFECMSKHGQGPELLGMFPTGRVEQFINARTLSACDLRNPDTSALIAAKLREFHGLEMPGSETKSVVLWDRLRKWSRVALNICSANSKEFSLDWIGDEIAALQNKLARENQKLGFCHNDLQYGNIMMDDETQSITIIDYEYSSHNPVAYDIANHFCEMAADYHTDTPHVLDYTKYPEIEERKRFVMAYISIDSSSDNKKSKQVEIVELLQDIEKYTLASHLLWGLWGIISDHVNGTIDFEYMLYARQRFQQYWERKAEILGS